MKPNTCNPIEQIAGKALFQNCAPNSCRRDSLTSICWQLIRLAFNHQEKFVKTRGYLALRILHADTPTRLSNESAREAQTFLDDLWNP